MVVKVTPVIKRRARLKRELARYVRVLMKKVAPERIIVFGSLATGDIHPWSDIDLVIVKQTNLTFFQRLREVRKLLRPNIGTDILVYTPEEFELMRKERPFFQQEVNE